MSKFFVGQRVRVVSSTRLPQFVGAETRIEGIDDHHRSPYILALRNGFRRVRSSALNIEPILPEGSAPSEFTFQQLLDNLQEVMA